MRSHKDLNVYKVSLELVTKIYVLTKQFPDDEKYGLISQIRRASISIPSNIAEGAARQSAKEFIRFLYMSLSSAAEVETQLDIASKLGFLKDNKEITDEIVYIKRMLIKLIESLKNKVISE
ncbi:MAG: four helix bundle protein [Winogradskyella sp.]|nr:four helix bundle protein [Winogradskyella sp.]